MLTSVFFIHNCKLKHSKLHLFLDGDCSLYLGNPGASFSEASDDRKVDNDHLWKLLGCSNFSMCDS